MSIKTKITSLVTTFILLCSLLTVGVFAVKNTTFNVGGNIEFKVDGIEAIISLTDTGLTNIVLPNGVTAGNQVLAPITITNETSSDSIASQFAKWANLSLAFEEGKSTASMEIEIENTSDDVDNFIDITALADATTKNNAYLQVSRENGEITALVGSGESAVFTITFNVINDEYKASLNGFGVEFDMKKVDSDEIPAFDADSRLTFTCNTSNKTASLTGNSITQADTELEIPRYVKSGDTICSVTSIGDNAFNMCDKIKSIIIPDTVTSIGSSAFFLGLYQEIVLPKGIMSIGANAFEACSGVPKNLIIPVSLDSFGVGAFTSTGVEEVIFENGVTKIYGNRFYGCMNLTKVSIPSSVTTIEHYAFGDCIMLSTINFGGTEQEWNNIVNKLDRAGNEYLLDATVNFNYTGE